METVFSLWFMLKCYKQGQSNYWLVRESSAESQPVKRRLGGCCEMAASLGTQLVELSVDKSSARAAVTRGPERGKLKNLLL
jgi:hypothetical protein